MGQVARTGGLDRTSAASARAVVERLYPDPTVRRACLDMLAESIIRAHAISPASWGVTLHTDRVRLNVAWMQPCVLTRGKLYLVIDNEAIDANHRQRVGTELGDGGRTGAAYASMPSAYAVDLPLGRLEELLPVVQPAHLALVEHAAARVRTRLHQYQSHSPGVVDYLQAELGRELPQPTYGPDKTADRDVWLFQANPTVYNLAEELKTKSVGDVADWSVSRYRDEMDPGETVLLWQGGEHAGIYALGELIGEPFERPTGEFWPDREDRPETEWAVPYRYTRILDRPLVKADLQRHPILRELLVIQMPQGTNFMVTPEQWSALQEMIDGVADDTKLTTRCWWVNQGTTYQQERDGGYLWAPKTGKGGYAFAHWTNMSKLRPGDVVLHYANGSIRAVGDVQEPVVDAPRPAELDDEPQGNEGYLVRITYHELQPPVPLAEIPSDWRVPRGGPFTQQGGVKQGYLYPLPGGFVSRLTEHFVRAWPDFLTDVVDRLDGGDLPDPIPAERRIVKIAPGPRAKYWDECLAEGYVCVGWDEIGDLRTFTNKEAFTAAFRQRYGPEYNGFAPKVTEKANEVWTLTELRPASWWSQTAGCRRSSASGKWSSRAMPGCPSAKSTDTLSPSGGTPPMPGTSRSSLPGA